MSEDHMEKPAGPVPGDMIAYVLIANALVALGVVSREWLLVLPLLLATGLHPLLAARIQLRFGIMGYLLLTLPFVFLIREHEVGMTAVFSLAFYVMLFLSTLAVVKLYRAPDGRRFPLILMYASLTLAGAITRLQGFRFFLIFFGFYTVAALLLLRAQMRVKSVSPSGRRRNLVGVGAAFAAAIALTITLGAGLNHYAREIQRTFMRAMLMLQLPSSSGFSRSAQLGSISKLRRRSVEQAVALRAFADAAPGYLRGKVFTAYNRGVWNCLGSTINRSGKKKERNYRVILPGRPAPHDLAEPQLRVYPTDRYRAHFFLPLQTAAVDTSSRTVLISPGNSLQSKYHPTTRGYGVLTDPAPVFDRLHLDQAGAPPDQDKVHPYYMQQPFDQALQAALRRVILRLGLMPEARAHPQAAIAALQQYFARRYTYRIGIDFDAKRDPLLQFLTEKSHGHCELFASAGTLILRRLGIPTRYVTGFVCAEKNPYGDFFIARNKHAHAWVEYFTPQKGWRLADFTPAAGRPTFEPKAGFDAFTEYLKGLWEQASGFFLRKGLGGIMELVGMAGNWLIASWWRILLVAVLGASYMFRRFWRPGRRGRARTRPPREFPRHIQEQREAFRRLQKDLTRLGLRKNDSETLEEYADRLAAGEAFPGREEAVRFLREFAAQRYAPFA